MPQQRKRKKVIAQTFGITQLYRMFPDEDACWKWLESVRWHGKPTCPHCGNCDQADIKPPPASKPHHWWCKPCRKHFTATTGTVMHSRRRPLQDWIYTIYSVLTARKGVSAMQLSKELDCHYRTAWYMLHRVREACGAGGFKLTEVVEIDETYIGGKRSAMSNRKRKELAGTGRGTVGKIPVVGLRERDGRLKATVLPAATDINKTTMTKLVAENVESGATVYTDEHGSYVGLAAAKFKHEVVNHGVKEYVNGKVHVNGIESVWAVLKRSIHGTWHHVSPKHLKRYIDEATFRLNYGNCEVDTIDRMRALTVRLLFEKPLPLKKLTADNGLSATAQGVGS
ncbi:MAG: IS1595 family transposase [Gammaproteobacteria bacterium]|nr:IS1595 family transposase [Gammaproteobacteria bacterium]MYE31032.1 IS1595 family transposase [Gammaproteobacteria bacterium]